MRRVRPVPLTTRPRVSVVIPCYNYGRYLPEAVASALDQSGLDVDVLIVDDCSTDDSAAIAQSIADADPRVDVLLHETNRGHIQTYNDGLAKVTGDYVVLLSADDLLTTDSLTRAVALMEAHPSVGLVYGSVERFTARPTQPVTGDVRHWVVWAGDAWARAVFESGRNALLSPEAVVRSSTLRRVGLYDAEHPHAGDLQMWLRIAAVADVGFVAGPVQACYREHGTNMHAAVFGVDTDRGMLTDLQHRRTAFAAAARAFPEGEELLALAMRAEAIEAVELAARAYVWGLRWPVEELVAFARTADPHVDRSVPGRALRRRRRLGHRLARRNPIFVVRERRLAHRRVIERRQAARTGLPR